MMIYMLALCLLLLVQKSSAFQIRNNAPSYAILSNDVASCTFSNHSQGLLCSFRRQNSSLVQYTSVKNVSMSRYHYCVTFEDDLNTMSCGGYIFSILGAPKDSEYLNPLTPHELQIGFHVESREVITVQEQFQGYNLLIDSLELNVITSFEDHSIEKVWCEEPLTTCIQFAEASHKTTCFGGFVHTFHNNSQSFAIGLIVSFLIAIIVLVIAILMQPDTQGFMVLLVVPSLSLLGSYTFTFRIKSWIVKSMPHLIGTLIGILLANMLFWGLFCLINTKLKKQPISPTNPVDNQDEIETIFPGSYIDSDDENDTQFNVRRHSFRDEHAKSTEALHTLSISSNSQDIDKNINVLHSETNIQLPTSSTFESKSKP